jgi:hypothetical protein
MIARILPDVTSIGDETMSDLPTIRSYHVIIDTTPEAVFDAVVDLRNFPKWAIHFCKDIRLVSGGAIVTTASGEVYFGITGDRDSGLIDWWSGPTMETAERWPTRVVPLPQGTSLYQVTAIFKTPPPPVVDEWFADELNALKHLVEERASVAA